MTKKVWPRTLQEFREYVIGRFGERAGRIFYDEKAAREYVENIRWPDGPVCGLCGAVGNATLMEGATTRSGLYKCKTCREPFTVTMGTLFERSHIPLHKWLLAIHMEMNEPVPTHALGKLLGLGSYKSAVSAVKKIQQAAFAIEMEELWD